MKRGGGESGELAQVFILKSLVNKCGFSICLKTGIGVS